MMPLSSLSLEADGTEEINPRRLRPCLRALFLPAVTILPPLGVAC